LAADPMHKMLLDRDPITGLDMASQPTLSRFEMALARASFIAWARRWPRA